MKKIVSIVLAIITLLSVFSISFSSFAATQNGWESSDGFWYYYENGYKIQGWKKINGSWYYFDYSQAAYMVTGVYPCYDYKKNETHTYYFDNSGKWNQNKNGWINDWGKWYYFKNGKAVEGWQLIKGKWYFFNYLGEMQVGLLTIKEKYYFFNNGGDMLIGWKKIKDKDTGNAEWIYADKSGILADTIWKKINNKWYYFGGYYLVHGGLNRTIENSTSVNDPSEYIHAIYFFKNDGTIDKNKTGWIKGDYSGFLSDYEWLYLKNGKALDGWQKINGNWYYLNISYFTTESTYLTGIHSIDESNKIYLFSKNGKWNSQKTGWVKGKLGCNYSTYNDLALDQPDNWFYFENGICRQNAWKKINGKWYYFDYDGMVTGDKIINGVIYHFDSNGICLNP